MEQVTELLAASRRKHGLGPMSRGFRLRLQAGQAALIKGVEDIADRLVATTERVGNLTGMMSTLTGQQNLATAYGKTLRGPQPSLHGLLLLSRKRTKHDRFTHAQQYPLFHTITLAIALGNLSSG